MSSTRWHKLPKNGLNAEKETFSLIVRGEKSACRSVPVHSPLPTAESELTGSIGTDPGYRVPSLEGGMCEIVNQSPKPVASDPARNAMLRLTFGFLQSEEGSKAGG